MKGWVSQLGGVERRAFVRLLARSVLGVSFLPVVTTRGRGQAVPPSAYPRSGVEVLADRGKEGAAKHVIYLFMSGGMSQLDTLDPKPAASTQGPVQAIRSQTPGLLLGESFPKLARRSEDLAVIRSLHSKQGAHEQGQYYVRTGYRPRGTIRHPALGAWTVRLGNGEEAALPRNVRIGGGSRHPGAGFLGQTYAPVLIADPARGLPYTRLPDDISEQRFRSRLRIAEFVDAPFQAVYRGREVRAHGEVFEEALKLMRSQDLDAFDLSKEPDRLRARYGNTAFGRGCLLARRLVSHGVSFVEVELGGWDTHGNNFPRVAQLGRTLDDALSALLEDLESEGMLRETLVVLATEFGRTPDINDGGGRDHYPTAFSAVLAGGGIRGGQWIGETDSEGREIADRPVSIPDFNATIAHALGLDLAQEIVSPSGRPFTMGHGGDFLTELF